MDVEQYQVRAFVAVAREGSVGAAARRLFRSQPAVTMAVRALERSLDVRLTERVGRGLRLSSAGETLFRLVEPLSDELDRTEQRFREALGGRVTGTLLIATDPDGILYLLPSAIRAFLRDHAGVHVSVDQREAPEALGLVRSGRADLAVCRVEAVPRDLEWRRVLTSDAVVIAPRRLRVPPKPSLAALVHHPMVAGPRTAVLTERVERALATRGLKAAVALSADNWETVKLCVGLGLGVAVVPDYCLQRQDRRITVLPARHLFGRETYGLVTRRHPGPSMAARLLAREVEKVRRPAGR